jgi:hypothetical protein
MGKKSKDAPAPPDPMQTARAEAQFNRLDTYSPSGSGVRHGYTDPSTGEFVRGRAPSNAQSAKQTVESDFERQIREALEPASVDLTQRVISDNIDGMPDAPRVGDRGTIAQDIFDRSFSLMAPAIEKTNSRLLSNLQARGLPVGGEAFNDAYGEQQAQTQDTLSRLAQDANVAAGQEQTRQFSLDQAERSTALSEIVAALGGGYNPPSGVPTGSSQPINYSGLVSQNYNAQMDQHNQDSQNKMAGAQAIGTLGSALIKSTKDAKTIEGELENGIAAAAVAAMPLYVWRYLPEHAPEGDSARHIGPTAEHFSAITGLGDGKMISVIDYLGLLAGALQNALRRIDLLEYQVAGGEMN